MILLLEFSFIKQYHLSENLLEFRSEFPRIFSPPGILGGGAVCPPALPSRTPMGGVIIHSFILLNCPAGSNKDNYGIYNGCARSAPKNFVV